MAKQKAPTVGGLYVFTWPRKNPAMRAVGRVTKVDNRDEYTDITVDIGDGKPPHKIILEQSTFEIAHPDELCGIKFVSKAKNRRR